MGFLSRATSEALPEAGALLAVEAIDRTGLVVTSEGALVRILHVTPPNPLILSAEGRADVAAAYCAAIARLRPGQGVQFYVEARPVNLSSVLADARREVTAHAGAPPQRDHGARDALALSRWRLYGAMEEGLRLHADIQAAVESNAYVVIPYVPSASDAKSLLAQFKPGRKLAAAPLERDAPAHRRAIRQGLAMTDAIRGEFEALNLPVRLLNGEEVVSLLWSRFNPTQADGGRRPPAASTEIVGELDAHVDAAEARTAAERLRDHVAQSHLDFERSSQYAEIDRDIEQTIYASNTADATYFGWLMSAMLTRQPYSLSVYVHALDRGRERQKLKLGYRRVFAINRGSESRGRVPDFDRYQQEQETERLLAEMAGHDRANLYEVSIYQSVRARRDDATGLGEAVDYCAEQIQTASDARVNKGQYQQHALWPSSLPLGRDVAGRARKYATRNVGDTIPLIGTACGSPSGVPFAYTDPGRELQLINPFDRAHPNGMALITGQSGSGKTMAVNLLLARLLAMGARGFILDRAGHYSVLVDLVHGARQIELGAEDARFAINPWDVPNLTRVSLEKVAFLVSLHTTMMGEEGLSTLERAQLAAAIRDVYGKAAVLDVAPRESMLRDELLARSDNELHNGAGELAAMLRNLAERIGEFCGDGAYAYLLDTPTSVPGDSPLIVFDTRRVPEVVLRPVMFSVLEFVTRTVEAHRDANRHLTARAGGPTFAGRSVVVIDEGWHLVGNPATGEYANDLARRSRHLGMALLVASQQLSDFNTEHGVALLRNSSMQLFLTQNADEIRFAQEALRLTDQEAAMIGRLKTVKGSHAQMFWCNGTRGRGVVAIRTSPTEYWAFSSDPIRDVPAREARIAEHGGDVWAAIADLAQHGPDSAPSAAPPAGPVAA